LNNLDNLMKFVSLLPYLILLLGLKLGVVYNHLFMLISFCSFKFPKLNSIIDRPVDADEVLILLIRLIVILECFTASFENLLGICQMTQYYHAFTIFRVSFNS